jgi:hypothetical protein
MTSASVESPETTRSRILLRACVGRTAEDLDSLKFRIWLYWGVMIGFQGNWGTL